MAATSEADLKGLVVITKILQGRVELYREGSLEVESLSLRENEPDSVTEVVSNAIQKPTTNSDSSTVTPSIDGTSVFLCNDSEFDKEITSKLIEICIEIAKTGNSQQRRLVAEILALLLYILSVVVPSVRRAKFGVPNNIENITNGPGRTGSVVPPQPEDKYGALSALAPPMTPTKKERTGSGDIDMSNNNDTDASDSPQDSEDSTTNIEILNPYPSLHLDLTTNESSSKITQWARSAVSVNSNN